MFGDSGAVYRLRFATGKTSQASSANCLYIQYSYIFQYIWRNDKGEFYLVGVFGLLNLSGITDHLLSLHCGERLEKANKFIAKLILYLCSWHARLNFLELKKVRSNIMGTFIKYSGSWLLLVGGCGGRLVVCWVAVVVCWVVAAAAVPNHCVRPGCGGKTVAPGAGAHHVTPTLDSTVPGRGGGYLVVRGY